MKRRKVKNSKSTKKLKKHLPLELYEAVVNEYAYIEKREAPLRLYFKMIASHVSVLYRPSHEYLMSIPWNEEGKEKLKSLLNMNIEEFYIWLWKIKARIPPQNTTLESSDHFIREKENWLNDAWITHTKNIMSELEIPFEQLYEEIPYSLIESFYS
jgi:hypothetical protein